MKIYKLQDLEKKGLLRISLVDDPAIQSTLMAFSSEDEKPMQFVEEEQMIIYAPALIPNKLIFRKNINGEPAQVFFDAETIKELHINGMRNGYDSNINLNHQENGTDGIFCIESWIVEDLEKDKTAKFGFEVPVGTLMKGYKVDKKEIWNDVKSGKLTGLSIEAYLLPSENEQVILKKENMNKKGFFAMAFEAFKAAWKFAEMTDYGSGYFGSSLEIGSIIADKDGNPMPNVEFEFEGNKYKTDDAGAISEVEPIEDASAGDGELEKAQARITELETEVADLKAAAQKAGETQMANEASEVKLKADYDASLVTITKLQEEVIEAKKVQHQNNQPAKSYDQMSNLEKAKFNRGQL